MKGSKEWPPLHMVAKTKSNKCLHCSKETYSIRYDNNRILGKLESIEGKIDRQNALILEAIRSNLALNGRKL